MPDKSKGYLYILVSVFIFSLFGLLTRIVSQYFPPFAVSFLREGFSFLLMSLLTIFGVTKWNKILKEDRLLVLFLGLTSMAGTVCMYYSFVNLPLGLNSSLVFGSSILFGWVIGIVFLKEKSTLAKIISLILVLLGISIMFNILNINLRELNVVGVTSGVLFGLFSAFYGTIATKISGDYGILQLYTIVALIVSLVSLAMSLLTKETLPHFEFNTYWMWLGIFGIFSIAANALYILGFKHKVEVSIVSIINPLQIIISALCGLIFLNEVIDLRTAIGGLLILAASATPYLAEKFKKEQSRK